MSYMRSSQSSERPGVEPWRRTVWECPGCAQWGTGIFGDEPSKSLHPDAMAIRVMPVAEHQRWVTAAVDVVNGCGWDDESGEPYVDEEAINRLRALIIGEATDA